MHRIRLLLVDDAAHVRCGLRMRLSRERDLEVIGEAGDGTSAVRLALALGPDVILLDLALPGVDGLATLAQMQAVVPRIAVVMLTLHDDAGTRVAAARAGAFALIGKHEPVSTLLATIRRSRSANR